VELVVVDDTLREERIAKDLKRVNRSNIPVNLIYPPNYPDEPAILLEELITPEQVLTALNRMEDVQEMYRLQADSNPTPVP
jgi:thiol:disulfide interchange protein